MLRIIVALIVFAIVDDACAGKPAEPLRKISQFTKRMLGSHHAIKVYRIRKTKQD